MLKSSTKTKILLKMSGSIAAFKVCALISKLVQAGYEVQVVASESALKFVGLATLEGLSGRKVAHDLFFEGGAMDHIHLVRWADLILVAPASAHLINRLAHGIGDDLLTTMFLAHDFKKPYLIAPAMNTSMYLHPVTQESIVKIRKTGVQILEAASGVLACGEIGWGRLLEPDLILAEVERYTSQLNSLKSVSIENQNFVIKPVPRVLVTSGGSLEPIDKVRVITNRSTGKTGLRIAETLYDLGCEVVLLRAASAARSERSLTQIEFTEFSEFSQKFKSLLSEQNWDWVVHAAALSDFHVELGVGKLTSRENQTLHLKLNPKLVNLAKDWSKSKAAKLISFKLTAGGNENERLEKVIGLQKSSNSDFVVHNDATSGMPNLESHQFSIYSATNKILWQGQSTSELAFHIAQLISSEGKEP